MIVPHWTKTPAFDDIKANCARFARKAFGTSSEMNIELGRNIIIKVRTEGHPAHDSDYVEYMRKNWEKFLRVGFGYQASIAFEVKVEAGDKQDGKPRDQVLWLPKIESESQVFGI